MRLERRQRGKEWVSLIWVQYCHMFRKKQVLLCCFSFLWHVPRIIGVHSSHQRLQWKRETLAEADALVMEMRSWHKTWPTFAIYASFVAAVQDLAGKSEENCRLYIYCPHWNILKYFEYMVLCTGSLLQDFCAIDGPWNDSEEQSNHGCHCFKHGNSSFIELDDGKIYRKALYLMVKTHGFPVKIFP